MRTRDRICSVRSQVLTAPLLSHQNGHLLGNLEGSVRTRDRSLISTVAGPHHSLTKYQKLATFSDFRRER